MDDLITITSSALPDSTRVIGFRGREALSRPYEIEIFLSLQGEEGDALDLTETVGCKAKLILDRAEDRIPPQIFAGILAHADLLHAYDGHSLVRAVLVPRLWLLGLSAHSRVFTGQTIPDIIQSVLQDNGIGPTDYDMQLDGYMPEEHICQYRESDLDFLSRWMEREGIYYWFEHTEEGEKLILRDDKDYAKDPIDWPVRYYPQLGQDRSAGVSFRSFVCRTRSLPGKVHLRDYDYARPNLNVASKARVAESSAEVSRYGERIFSPSAAERLARVRAEEMLATQSVYEAAGTRTHLRPGYVFELADHPRGALNTRYLATEVHHHGNQAAGAPHFSALVPLVHDEVYFCEVLAVQADVQYRPPSRTPWPRIYGYETAIIDGPAESEYAQIDGQGRYKVKFKFDESSRKGDKASTFLRMMQPHGGAIEGFHFPLRKGTEVVVCFMGGDPDRPVISGFVPNALTPSPVTGANHTKNVIQTGGRNRVEMEDLAGSQFIDISSPPEKTHVHLGAHHGPHKHNWLISTTGNGLINTGGDRNITVGGEQTEDVKGNLTEDYHSDQTTHVFGAFKETIDAGATQTISAGSTQTINGGATQTIDGGETRTVTGGVTETLSGGRTQTINGGSTETVNGDVAQLVTGNVTETVGGSATQLVGGSLAQTITGDISTVTPGSYKIVATGGMQVVAQAGWQLIAPGGTTTVDSFFDKTGGKSIDAFAFKMSITGAKVDIVPGLAFGYTAIKVDVTQLKVDIAMTKYANNPITLKTFGQVVQAGYLALHGVAFCMIT